MLNALPKLTTNKIKRVGRGIGSGVGGHTAGRGNKGHRARAGKSTPLWFEGGQLPLIRRMPFWRGKFRFKSLNAIVQEVQVGKLSLLNGADVTPETLLTAKLIKSVYRPVKLIGNAKLEKVSNVRGVSLSDAARKSVEAAGGIIE